MNLETSISEILWGEIHQEYESSRYTDAIKNAIYHLSNIIREKANLEGDGAQLIGDAFGGADPKIKVSKLQTENDKNVQRGMESLLRGIYQAIRNPRSHDKGSDSKEDADAIILFIDYLIRIINKSKAQFSIESFLLRVFDRDLVETPRYVNLLVGEIPGKKRMDVMLEVIKRKERGFPQKLHHFFNGLLAALGKDEQAEVLQILSDELKTADEFSAITTTVQILNPIDWPKIQEVSRLRIENKFVKSIKEGSYNPATNKCTSGVLGTWSTSLIPYFTLKSEVMEAIITQLLSESLHSQIYAVKFFARSLPQLAPKPNKTDEFCLRNALKEGNQQCYEAVKSFKSSGLEGWIVPFEDALAKFVPVEKAPSEPEDDAPF